MTRSRSCLRLVAGAALLLALGGCGESDSETASRYPVVEDPPARMQPAVTTSNGAIVQRPYPPTVHEVEPSPTCESTYVHTSDGGQRRAVIPPRPGLRAIAVTEHTTRLEWWFDELPDDCSSIVLYLVVAATSSVNAVPWVERDVEVNGMSGSKEVTYPDFLPAPDVASASAYLPDGLRSRVAKVLIKRAANTPPDPPDPIPPVTAPAGKPIACSSRPTVVSEPSGDVLTYAPGDPPAQVRKMTPALKRIDITRASVQIDGLTICASFTFAQPPTNGDFRVRLNLSSPPAECCGSLQFERTAGRLEVGRHFVDSNGVYQLEPVKNAGAELRGRTLVMTGTLPQVQDSPIDRNLRWSVTTHYHPVKYGPDFGDWLPRHEPIDQPAIRHRDGAIVRT